MSDEGGGRVSGVSDALTCDSAEVDAAHADAAKRDGRLDAGHVDVAAPFVNRGAWRPRGRSVQQDSTQLTWTVRALQQTSTCFPSNGAAASEVLHAAYGKST
jgi:hypothetical protein